MIQLFSKKTGSYKIFIGFIIIQLLITTILTTYYFDIDHNTSRKVKESVYCRNCGKKQTFKQLRGIAQCKDCEYFDSLEVRSFVTYFFFVNNKLKFLIFILLPLVV